MADRSWRAATVVGLCGWAALAGFATHGRDPDIAGDYDTAVALGHNSCGDVTIAPGITTIARVAGDSAFALTHGPLTYHAARQADGRFTTDTQSIRLSDGSVAVAVQGTVGGGRLSAVASVWMRRAAPCSYTVAWTGTRRSAR